MALAHAMTSLLCICFLLHGSISLRCSQEDGEGVEGCGRTRPVLNSRRMGGRRVWEDQTCPELLQENGVCVEVHGRTRPALNSRTDQTAATVTGSAVEGYGHMELPRALCGA